MPTHCQHTLITWVPQSIDGKREATRLHQRYRKYSVLRKPENLGSASDFMSLIVVGHRQELMQPDVFQSLISHLTTYRASWVVLAACDSGTKEYLGTLQNNDWLSPAQRVANELDVKVSGTTRPLLFVEVGESYAFALVLGEILLRKNPHYDDTLWKDYVKQESVEELTEMFGSL